MQKSGEAKLKRLRKYDRIMLVFLSSECCCCCCVPALAAESTAATPARPAQPSPAELTRYETLLGQVLQRPPRVSDRAVHRSKPAVQSCLDPDQAFLEPLFRPQGWQEQADREWRQFNRYTCMRACIRVGRLTLSGSPAVGRGSGRWRESGSSIR